MAVRKVCKSGEVSKSIILPSQICEDLGIKVDDRMDVVRKGNKIIITKVVK